MLLSSTVVFLKKVLEPGTRWVNRAGVIVLAAMMFLTATDVILRYIFNRPVPGSYELQEFMMSIMLAVGIGYCGFLKGHISVDIFISHLKPRAQSCLNAFHYFVGFVLFAAVCWQTAIEGLSMYSRQLESSVLSIPKYPFYFVLVFGAAVLCVVFFYNFLESLLAVGKWKR